MGNIGTLTETLNTRLQAPISIQMLLLFNLYLHPFIYQYVTVYISIAIG